MTSPATAGVLAGALAQALAYSSGVRPPRAEWGRKMLYSIRPVLDDGLGLGEDGEVLDVEAADRGVCR